MEDHRTLHPRASSFESLGYCSTTESIKPDTSTGFSNLLLSSLRSRSHYTHSYVPTSDRIVHPFTIPSPCALAYMPCNVFDHSLAYPRSLLPNSFTPQSDSLIVSSYITTTVAAYAFYAVPTFSALTFDSSSLHYLLPFICLLYSHLLYTCLPCTCLKCSTYPLLVILSVTLGSSFI